MLMKKVILISSTSFTIFLSLFVFTVFKPVLAAIGAGVTSNDLANKVNNILTYAMGAGGVVAFILIVVGAFQIILSAGSPDKVKAGKEMITSALAGLFLIIFSVLILKLIGVDILQLPEFKP